MLGIGDAIALALLEVKGRTWKTPVCATTAVTWADRDGSCRTTSSAP